MTPSSQREREPDRRPRARAAAASRSLPRCARPADRRAECVRQSAFVSVVDRRTRSARRTGPRAARAGCRRRTSAASTARSTRRCDVAAAVERIDVLAGQRIPGDRVDGEVAPPRRLLDRQRRIAGDGESLVPAAGLRLAPRQRHVDVADLVDGEALADGVDRPERSQHALQRVRRRRRRPRRRCPSTDAPSADRATQPPTTSARPPASRTARAIVAASAVVMLTASSRPCRKP